MLKDISEFQINDTIKSFGSIIYKVINIKYNIIKQNKKIVKQYYSEIANIETGEIQNATHFKNKCFIKVN